MKKLVSLFLALTLIFALAACGGTSGSNESAAPGTGADPATSQSAGTDAPKVLNVGTNGNSGGFNQWNNSQTYLGTYLVYDTPVVRLSDGSYGLGALESYNWVDNKTLVMTLKDNVYFADGDQMLAEDLIYSYRMYVDSPSSSLVNYYNCVDYDASYVSDDGLTATLVFSTEYGPFFAWMEVFIINKSACEDWSESDERWWDQPIGSGPYELVENVAGSHESYRLRADYWDAGNAPEWEEINVYYYSDQTAMFVAYQNGEIDLALNLANNDAARIKNGEVDSGYGEIGSNAASILTFSPYKEEFQDINVRMALTHALDFNAIGEVAYGVLFAPCDSVLTSGTDYYKSVGAFEYDLDYAKECLAASAYPNGFEIKILGKNDPNSIKMYDMLQAYWSELGITVNIETYDLSTAIPSWMEEGATDIMTMTVNGGNAAREPHSALSSFASIGPFPASRILDAAYEEEFNKAVYTNDSTQRAAAYDWLQDYYHDNYQCIPMYEDLYAFSYDQSMISSVDIASTSRANLRFVLPA